MFFQNNYIEFSPKLIINSISNYRNIMTKFANKYIELYGEKSVSKQIISDAIIYSKYYLYYKTKNCVYSEEIMEILLNVEFNFHNLLNLQ